MTLSFSLFGANKMNLKIVQLVLCLVFSMYLYVFLGNLTTWRAHASDSAAEHRLEDVLARRVPYHYLHYVLGCIFIMVAELVGMISIDLYRKQQQRVYALVYAEIFLLLFGSLCHLPTSVPDSNYNQHACGESSFATLGLWVFTNLTTDFCGDMLWSASTSHVMLIAFYMQTGVKGQPWWLRMLVWCTHCLFVGFVTTGIIVNHVAYTVDVLIAGVVTLLVLTNDSLIRKMDEMWSGYLLTEEGASTSCIFDPCPMTFLRL